MRVGARQAGPRPLDGADHTRVQQRSFMAYRERGPCSVNPVFYILNMDTQDRQDKKDETLRHSRQSIYCNSLITIDLLRISRLRFPHYIPLSEKESTGPFGKLADVTARSSRDGLDPDEVGGVCNHRRSVGSALCASPGRRMDSTAWPNDYGDLTSDVTWDSSMDVQPDRMRMHGFRAMATTLLDEASGTGPDLIE